MDTPYYEVKVSNLTSAWDYSVVQGEAPDETEPVLLADQLTYDWGFDNGVVPGQLVPATGSYGLYCQTAADVPALQIGDVHELAVYVTGADGGPVALKRVLKVTSVEITLDPEDPELETHPIYVDVRLVDHLADLRGLIVDQPLGSAGIDYARLWWRPRLAEVGALIGASIGSPAWWAGGYDGEQPDPGTGGPGDYYGLTYVDPETGDWNGKSGHELLTQLLNSHQPDGITHTLVPYYGPEYPLGYEYVGPATWGGQPAIADPISNLRYLVVPSSRVDGYHGVIELDGDWCDVPAKARRSREHVINSAKINGRAWTCTPQDAGGGITIYDYKSADAALSYDNATDIVAAGVSAREIPTQLRLYEYPPSPLSPWTAAAPAIVADRFLTDDSARDAGWTYDTFRIYASDIPQIIAGDLLPKFFPDPAGGLVLNHVTLSNLDPSIDFGAGEVSGFLTHLQLAVLDGDLIYDLTLTPGDPT